MVAPSFNDIAFPVATLYIEIRAEDQLASWVWGTLNAGEFLMLFAFH